MGKENKEVCLVMPPCTFPHMPSLALGLLKSCLMDAGISCYVDYANIYFINEVGTELYRKLYQGRLIELPSEFIFNRSAGIINSYSACDMIRSMAGKDFPEQKLHEFENLIKKCEHIVPAFIEHTVERILTYEPKAVGCSAVFEQRNAGLAILRRIKELRPEIRTFMGGYNCFGEAGIAMLKEFPYLDYVFFGESDDIFADTIKTIIAGTDEELPYGVLKNDGKYPETAPHRILMDMNKSHVPDYDEFFELINSPVGQYALQGSGLEVSIASEASRGCWWGEKHQCTFCGVNGKTRKFRKKDTERVLKELECLTGRYNCRRVVLCDCILPQDAYRDLLPGLIDQGAPYDLSVEIKSNISPDKMRILDEAGCSVVQPGIESLSDHQLQLMSKGVSAIQNVAMLKYAKACSCQVRWNILTGFPGETIEDYFKQDKIIPLIEHLDPPMGVIEIAYVKDNVYCNDPEKYGLRLETPQMFRCISPEGSDYYEKIAFFFEETALKKDPVIELGKAALRKRVMEWKQNNIHAPAELYFMDDGEFLQVTDTRHCAVKNRFVLNGLKKTICMTAREPVSVEKLSEVSDGHHSREEINDALEKLCDDKLMIFLSGRFLFLATEKKTGCI